MIGEVTVLRCFVGSKPTCFLTQLFISHSRSDKRSVGTVLKWVACKTPFSIKVIERTNYIACLQANLPDPLILKLRNLETRVSLNAAARVSNGPFSVVAGRAAFLRLGQFIFFGLEMVDQCEFSIYSQSQLGENGIVILAKFSAQN